MYQRRRWHPTPVLLPGNIPWTEEPDRLQSMGSWRVGHDWAISLSLFTFMCIGEGNGNPLQCSCLENPRDGGAWWAAAYGVAQSRTRLKRLSSSSSKETEHSPIRFGEIRGIWDRGEWAHLHFGQTTIKAAVQTTWRRLNQRYLCGRLLQWFGGGDKV